MITYEQAKKLALRYEKDANTALDYGNAYFFYDKNRRTYDDPGIVVMKDNAEIMSFSEYVLTKDIHKKPVQIPF
ncbi:MAG: hypothetical protein HUJ63_09030 [Enterococcus sp.]|nr:hypothetical protein [Enterococcus sp.]